MGAARQGWRRRTGSVPRLVLLATAAVLVAAAVLVSGRLGGGPSRSPHQGQSAPAARPSASGGSQTPHIRTAAPIFAMYYLWWDRQHWTSRLGHAYLAAAPTRTQLPASVDAAGCGTVNLFAGNVETDISPGLGYDQANPRTIRRDVQLAAAAGLDGFLVNWVGTGAAHQVPASSDLDKRLDYVIDAVHAVQASGHRFTLILNYQSSAKKRPQAQFANDFTYFLSRYGADRALDHHYSAHPEVLIAGTWKYTDAEVQAISAGFRSRFYLIGDEKPASWDPARAQALDGSSYYWSSQDPERNKASFTTLERFADTVRQTPNPDGRPKTWLAPFTPGYNAMLLYNTPTCVPRNDGRTMAALFAGNSRSKPDGWTFISWNEISEGTYVVPLTRYGMRYLTALEGVIRTHR
jgi:hypothetical protein